MAYSRRKSASRSRARGRSAGSRSGYRSRSVRRPARSRATSARRRSGGQTIRIEIVGSGADNVSRQIIVTGKPYRCP